MSESISIEVAFALPHQQYVLQATVPRGTTAREAIVASKIQILFPEVDLLGAPCGVFSQVVSPDYVLQAGDRLELYRPLQCDPQQKIQQYRQKKLQASS